MFKVINNVGRRRAQTLHSVVTDYSMLSPDFLSSSYPCIFQTNSDWGQEVYEGHRSCKLVDTGAESNLVRPWKWSLVESQEPTLLSELWLPETTGCPLGVRTGFPIAH